MTEQNFKETTSCSGAMIPARISDTRKGATFGTTTPVIFFWLLAMVMAHDTAVNNGREKRGYKLTLQIHNKLVCQFFFNTSMF